MTKASRKMKRSIRRRRGERVSWNQGIAEGEAKDEGGVEIDVSGEGDGDDGEAFDAGAATKASAVCWLLARSFWPNSLTSFFAAWIFPSFVSSSSINICLLLFPSSLRFSKVPRTRPSRLLSSSSTLARSSSMTALARLMSVSA